MLNITAVVDGNTVVGEVLESEIADRLKWFLRYGYAGLDVPRSNWHRGTLCIPLLNLLNEYIGHILNNKLTCHLLVPDWMHTWRVALTNNPACK